MEMAFKNQDGCRNYLTAVLIKIFVPDSRLLQNRSSFIYRLSIDINKIVMTLW